MIPQYPLCTKWRPLHNNWSCNPCTEEEEEVMEITLRRSPVGWMEIEHQFAQSPWAETAQAESCCRTARSRLEPPERRSNREGFVPESFGKGKNDRAESSPAAKVFVWRRSFFLPAERLKETPRKFPCVKVGRFPRSTGPSRNPVLLLPVSKEKTDSFAFALPPRSFFSGESFFFFLKE